MADFVHEHACTQYSKQALTFKQKLIEINWQISFIYIYMYNKLTKAHTSNG